MASSHVARLRPVASLICLAVLVTLASPAESGSKPYLLIQHQVYEEHQEVLGKSPSNRSAAAYRKNDEEELFDFIKDYLFNRGGAQKLNSRSGNGRAQFVGVDSGGANGSAASGGADKDSGESAQRYKMHIIKFRLVNASHPAVAATRNAQAMTMHKKGDHAPPEPFHKEHHTDDGGELHSRGYHGNSTPSARHWGGRYWTSHPTHVTTAHTDLFPALPRRAAPAAAPGNCELPETTKVTTKRTTAATTTTRHTTTTRRTTTTTTTTPKPTTTTKRTTTCAPTTVAAVGCERAPPPATTSRRTTTTTTEAPQVYLHGHPYVVIKLHEVKGTRRVPSHRFSPPPPYLRFLLANGTYPNKTHLTRNDSLQVPEHRVFWLPGSWPEAGEGTSGGNSSGHQPRAKKQQQQQHQQHQQLPQQHQQQKQQRSRSRRMPAYAAETAALKREVAGNLMRVLRTIRELDSLAEQDQQDVQQPEEVQDQQLQPEMPQQQATYELVAPDAAAEIDQLLRRRDRSQRFRSQDRGATEYPDELRENRAEEGDLHQFSILLKKALDELSVQPEDKNRAIRKPHKAPAAAVYR